MDTQTVFVVDQDGATFVFLDKADAENCLIQEAWSGAVHLTITRAQAPVDLDMDALVEWCIAKVAPTTCEAQ